ncbi:hypothetical protein D6C84_08387 [Aureobasidium pullulans]|uniref:Protein kinase domain-containing protein n=1 Tax=Aureobasidium pullulans TaxID=5580 RepID=A0A4S9XER0_AURPU|nr:hypothetical protein D6C84_08387 [Aureobasidium pullulans]
MTDEFDILPHTHGYTSTIYILAPTPSSPTPRICKSFNSSCIATHFPVELEAYTRFSAAAAAASTNPNIPIFYGVHPTLPAGLVLSRAGNRDIYDYLWQQRHMEQPPPEKGLLHRWCQQAAAALEFAHGLGVLNSDIHPVNLFLDDGLDLLVGDWAGASIDGGISHSTYRLKYRLYSEDGKDVVEKEGISAKSEIFALGSTMWYIIAGKEIWDELTEPSDEREIRRRLAGKEFPNTSGLAVLGNVVMKCWRAEFREMKEVRRAIEVERDSWTVEQDSF